MRPNNLFRLGLLCLALGLTARAADPAAPWENDFSSAWVRAKAEHRPLLVAFLGTDWDPASASLDQEIFSRSQFANYARASLVLARVEILRKPSLSPDLIQRNAALVRQYQVSAVPAVILIGPDGTVLGRFGYMQGGPWTFVREIKRCLESAAVGSPGGPARPAAP